MMATITKPPQMVRRGPVEIAVAALSAAVPGASIHGSSARPAAAGSRPTTGATPSVFGLGGRFPLEFCAISERKQQIIDSYALHARGRDERNSERKRRLRIGGEQTACDALQK